MITADAALLALRLLIGLLFVGHGLTKWFGVWGGPGIARFTTAVAGMGLRPARPLAYLAVWSQLVGGGLLALGLLTPLACLAIGTTMAVAVRRHWSDGFWSPGASWQYPFVLLGVLLVQALAGPGAYSLDAALFTGR